MRTWTTAAVLASGLLSACTDSGVPVASNATPAVTTPSSIAISPVSDRPRVERAGIAQPWSGDLDAIVDRGYLRVLVPASRTHFEDVGGHQHGRTVDAAAALEAALNQSIAPRKVAVVLIETREDALVRDLLARKGDVAANLLVTFDRDDQVAFASPIRKGIRELVVTGSGEAVLVSLEDVGGRVIHVRRGSDHHPSLLRLNEQLTKINRPPARIVVDAQTKTDEDLLERVNTGRIPATLADDYVLDFWRKEFPKVVANRDVAVSQDGILAWATRKDAPKLLALLNTFFSTHSLTF